MTKQRILYLDVIRIIACCMIVLMHSPHPQAGNPNYVVVLISFMTAAGIGLFFMVSGALLLPVEMPTMEFLRNVSVRWCFQHCFGFFSILPSNICGAKKP